MPIERTWTIDSVRHRQLVEAEGDYGPDIEGDIATHEADTTSVHGIANTAVLASDAELAAHEADSTSVHGIANTAVLVTSPDILIIDVVTQAAYDALSPPVATTLYVIVG